MARASTPRLALALLLLFGGCMLAASVAPQEEQQLQSAPGDPPGLALDENGKHYLMAHGVKYFVYRDSDSNKIFYVNTETEEPQWVDPRDIAAFEADAPILTSASKPTDTLSVAVVAVIPMILFIGIVAGRIYYLHTYYPELLFPTKERRDRRRASGGKFKAQKARGKMNQDGKGGRSANS